MLNHFYASFVDYLKDWFERRKIKLNITPPDSNEQIELDIFDDDHELMMTNANINMNNDAIATPIVDDDDNAASAAASLRRIAASAAAFQQQQQNTRVDLNKVDGKSLIENLSRELRMMDDCKKFLEMPVILGYNSGKYDIPLIKKEFFHQVFVKDAHPTDKRHLNIIRKGTSCYTSIQLSNMNLRASGGCYGFVLKDMREFTGPGGNLKTFMKAFQESTTTTTTTKQANNSDDGKFYFPYEWLERYEQLKETELPPYECFFSSLKDMNVLEEDMFLYKKKKNLLHLDDEEIVATSGEYADRPNSGRGNYEMIKRTWVEKGWKTMLDYLMYYNEMDVEPFLKSISVFLKALCPHKVNPLFESTSLPGVAKRISSQYMPPGTIYYLDRELIFRQMKKAEVGGQSIVMTRENPETHPYIVGYDACSLYLSRFAKNHFIGRPQGYVEEPGSPYLRYDYEYDAPPLKLNASNMETTLTRLRLTGKRVVQ